MQIITGNRPLNNKGFLATTGVFDGVHRGHRYLIKELIECAAAHDLTPLAITFLSHPTSVLAPEKETPLLLTLAERLRRLEMTGLPFCYLLDFSKEMSLMSASEFMSFIKESIGVKGILAGFNHSFGKKEKNSLSLEEIAKSHDMLFFRASEFHDKEMSISSTVIREALSRSEVKKASELLGYPYELTGKVTHGSQKGRTIGFPTANITPDNKFKLIPGRGVYACRALIDDCEGTVLPAMVNIGMNPTLGLIVSQSIEAHIIGLPQATDLYGRTVTIQFLEFLRNERKFPGLNDLKHQLETDRENVLKIIA